MDALLVQKNISVNTDLDRVVLRYNRLIFPMPYAQAFKIAAGLRLGSKRAMRISGESIKDWRNRSRLDVYTPLDEISKNQRATTVRRYDWRIDVDGEMVFLIMDNQKIGFHFEAALKAAEWLRWAGKRCKRWAGDGGRSMISLGTLTDAEENYKRGY